MSRFRWGVAAGLIVAAAGLFSWRFLGEPVEVRLLRSLPAGQAVYAYFDADRVRASRLLGPAVDQVLAENPTRRLLAAQLDAGALAVGQDTIYLVLAAAVPETWLRGYLGELGAECAQPLDEAACQAPRPDGSGSLSVRLLAGDVVAIVNGPDPNAADSLAAVSGDGAAALAAPAAQATAAGALAWIEIDPPRLAAVMRNPPAGWINLSLVARALIHSPQARVTLFETGEDRLEVRLRAVSDDAAELARLLAGLNRFGAAALRQGEGAEASLWADALDSFTVNANDNGVEGRWSLDAELLTRLLSSEAAP